MAKETVKRHFASAALSTGTKAELSEETAEAAVKMACLEPEEAITDPLWCLPDELPL